MKDDSKESTHQKQRSKSLNAPNGKLELKMKSQIASYEQEKF